MTQNDRIVSTEAARIAYADGIEARSADGLGRDFTTTGSHQAEFDRWLGEVKAAAWDEGFRAGDEAATGHLTKNPYRDTAVDI